MCAPSPPPAPDYAGQAKEQGVANIQAAKVQGKINNPNVVSPYGTQTTTYGSGLNQSAYDEALKGYYDKQQQYDAAGGVQRIPFGSNGRGGQPGGFQEIPLAKPVRPDLEKTTWRAKRVTY